MRSPLLRQHVSPKSWHAPHPWSLPSYAGLCCFPMPVATHTERATVDRALRVCAHRTRLHESTFPPSKPPRSHTFARGKRGRPPPRPLTARAQAGRFQGYHDLPHLLQGRCARSSRAVFVKIGRKCLVSAFSPDSGHSATMAATIVAALRAPTCRAVARRRREATASGWWRVWSRRRRDSDSGRRDARLALGRGGARSGRHG